jgi:hypothetical protein
MQVFSRTIAPPATSITGETPLASHPFGSFGCPANGALSFAPRHYYRFAFIEDVRRQA